MNEKRDLFPRVPLYYSIPLLAIFLLIFSILIFIFRIETPLFQPAPIQIPPNAINISSCGILSQNDGYYIFNRSFNITTDSCITITGKNIVLDGQSMYSLGEPLVNGFFNAINITGNNVTITRLNITGVGPGPTFLIRGIGNAIYSTGNQTKIINNYFKDILFYAISLEYNDFNEIKWNIVYNSSNGIGLYQSNNNQIENNFVKGYPINVRPLTSYGIYLRESDFNVIANSTFEQSDYSIAGVSSDSNFMSGINSIDSFQTGLDFRDSYANVLVNGYVLNPQGYGIYLITPYLISSPFVLDSFTAIDSKIIGAKNQSSHSLYAYNPSYANANFSVNLVNTSVESYSFNSPYIYFSNSFGEIRFNRALSLAGTNLSSDIKIENNSFFVNSTLRPGLNRSATLTIFDIPTNFSPITILRDGIICPSIICSNLSYGNSTRFNGTGFYESPSINFNVTGWTSYKLNYLASPSISQTMTIEEPDADDRYNVASFPVTFDVRINSNGSVKFSLNNGSTNVTMNTTDNRTFTYSQNILSLGNYTFIAYANFSNGTLINNFVRFSVVNTTGSTGGNNRGSSSGGSSSGTSGGTSGGVGGTTGGNFTGGGTTTSGTSSGGTSGGVGGESNTALRNTIYWFVVSITSIIIIILIVLIYRAVRQKKFDKGLSTFNISKPASNQLMSNLR